MASRKEIEEIAVDIDAYILSHGGRHRAWYVGISQNARKRLFEEHNVKENEDLWIIKTASSSEVAREVEEYFVNSLGTNGAPGGGDETTNQVYAYRKALHTDP